MAEYRNSTLIAAAILALGIVVGGYLLGDGVRRARMTDRSVTMRGLAERDVTANLATWNVSYSTEGTDLASVQAASDRDTGIVAEFFRRAGFDEKEVNSTGIGVSQYRDSDTGVTRFTVNRSLQLRTGDVMKARAAYARQADLIRAGVPIQEGSGMSYSFTKLNEVKPEMIAESTKDARRAAEQFAKDSGAEVGAIKQATQGYFSIEARDGEEGESGSNSPFQKVRVVTTIDFYLD